MMMGQCVPSGNLARSFHHFSQWTHDIGEISYGYRQIVVDIFGMNQCYLLTFARHFLMYPTIELCSMSIFPSR